MNRQRLLRVLILIDVFSMVGGVLAAVIFERTLPEPLRTHAATEEVSPFLLIAGLLLLGLLIAAWIGLWRSAVWAPAVYAVMWVSCVVVVPFSGPFVGTGIEEMFDFVGTAAGGGILVLVLLAMEERRSSGQGPLVATGTMPELLHNDPDLSEEIVQPNMKSWRVHQMMSALYGLIALMLLALPYVAQSGGEELSSVDMALATLVPLFFFALSGFHYFVSRGAKNRKRWARIGSIILACSLLPGVPVGTIIGVYLLRNSSWSRNRGLASGE